jgi:hypothetical protein
VALAGRIEGLAPPDSQEPAAVDIPLQISGGSAAIATTPGRAESLAAGVDTRDPQRRLLARFGSAQAQVSHVRAPERITTARAEVRDFAIGPGLDDGFGTSERTVFHVGHALVEATCTHYRRPGPEFDIRQAVLDRVEFERVEGTNRQRFRLIVELATSSPNDHLTALGQRGTRLCIRSYRELVRSRRIPEVAASFLPHSPLRPSSFCWCFCTPKQAARHVLRTPLRWDNQRAYPDSVIGLNYVFIPGFGTVHFGETYDAYDTRVVTLARFQLGCPMSGSGSVAFVRNNGGDYPP